MIRLVLADVDNTLNPLGSQAASPLTKEAIDTLKAAGVEFGCATGRDIETLRGVFGEERYLETGIFSSGKDVRLDGRQLVKTYVPKDALHKLTEWLDTIEEAFSFAFCAGEDRLLIGLKCSPEQAAEAARRAGDVVHPVEELETHDVDSVMIRIPGDPARAEELVSQAQALIPELEFASPYDNFFDVMPAGVNKATGLMALLSAMGVSPSEVVFFGDSGNDLGLMELIPDSVAVANASPVAAEAARWHVGPCEEDSVAHAMLEIARCANTGETPSFMQ